MKMNEFEIKNGVLITYNGNAEKITIPESVTSIGRNAFSNCSYLKEIIIPEGVIGVKPR